MVHRGGRHGGDEARGAVRHLHVPGRRGAGAVRGSSATMSSALRDTPGPMRNAASAGPEKGTTTVRRTRDCARAPGRRRRSPPSPDRVEMKPSGVTGSPSGSLPGGGGGLAGGDEPGRGRVVAVAGGTRPPPETTGGRFPISTLCRPTATMPRESVAATTKVYRPAMAVPAVSIRTAGSEAVSPGEKVICGAGCCASSGGISAVQR